jgi:hypothetical protein
MTTRPPLSFLRIFIYLFTRTPMCCLFKRAVYLVDSLFGGLSLFGGILVPFCLLVRSCLLAPFFPSSKDWITLTLRYQLRQKWRN